MRYFDLTLIHRLYRCYAVRRLAGVPEMTSSLHATAAGCAMCSFEALRVSALSRFTPLCFPVLLDCIGRALCLSVPVEAPSRLLGFHIGSWGLHSPHSILRPTYVIVSYIRHFKSIQ